MPAELLVAGVPFESEKHTQTRTPGNNSFKTLDVRIYNIIIKFDYTQTESCDGLTNRSKSVQLLRTHTHTHTVTLKSGSNESTYTHTRARE